MAERTDAIVVGLGAVGGIIAEQLARDGVKVTALDKGPHYPKDYFRFKQDEIRYYTRGSLVPHLSTDPITWRANDGETATMLPWASGPLGTSEPLHLPPSIGTGGGTLHWGGACWRFREADFRMRTTILQRFGKDALPEDATIVNWPLSYQELEPYYDGVEWELGVSGQAGNIGGELVPGGNPFEAPRRRGYPMPPLQSTAGTRRFRWRPPSDLATIRFRRLRQWRRLSKTLKPCVYCGFCHGYPCHVGAKQSTHVTCIPRGARDRQPEDPTILSRFPC